MFFFFFFFKQKTAYEIYQCDWSSDVCSSDLIEYQGGLIPIYKKNVCVQKGKIYLVGDAAGQIKNTTGGGLVYGLKAAKILTDCIINNKNYKKELKNLEKGLWVHSMIRRIIDKFSDKDYNKLIKIVDSKKIKNVLNKNNRDNPKMLILKSILAKPSLLLFIKKLIKIY